MIMIVAIFEKKCAFISVLMRNYIEYEHISYMAQTVL